MLLATVCAAKEVKEGTDFMPLTVDYKEKFYAAGRFPGGFMKREGKSSDYEILISRLIDRPIRPLWPSDYHLETFVNVTLISADKDTQPDALAGLAASCALAASDLPFEGPISKFIHRFSRGRSFYVVCCFGIAVAFLLLQLFRHKHLRMVHFRDISSFYPTLLCITVSGGAALYGSIQRFVPETWEEFYFHPTLNPLHPDLPLILALFIASVWTMIIVGVAVVEELRRQPDLGDGLAYLASLGGVCMLLYLVFTQTVPLYFGYPLLLAYWAWAVMRYVRHRPSHFLCGNCNNPIPTGTDICPKCGMRNSL